jgi:hypothetical protein
MIVVLLLCVHYFLSLPLRRRTPSAFELTWTTQRLYTVNRSLARPGWGDSDARALCTYCITADRCEMMLMRMLKNAQRSAHT